MKKGRADLIRGGTIPEESRLTNPVLGELRHWDRGLDSRGIAVHTSYFWGIVPPLDLKHPSSSESSAAEVTE